MYYVAIAIIDGNDAPVLDSVKTVESYTDIDTPIFTGREELEERARIQFGVEAPSAEEAEREAEEKLKFLFPERYIE